LVANYLLTKDEKRALIEELKFKTEDLWLKDYYISRIEQNIRSASEAEGFMTVKSLNTTSIHNNIGDDSSISPSRF